MLFNFSKVLSFLLPPTCLRCHVELRDEGALCGDCWKQMHFISHPFCEDCGVPFDYAPMEKSICERCLAFPPLISRSRSVFVYNSGCKPLVMRLKYGDATYLAKEAGRWMSLHGRDCLEGADLLIPVPLHRWRLLKRRYNQATLLARSLSKNSHIPLLTGILTRTKKTVSQGHMSLVQRKRNVSRAFEILDKDKESVRGKCCILIDDVQTTGATLTECARILKEAGAKEIRAITLAMVRVDEERDEN